MILVDASIWIDHLRRPSALLADILARQQVLMHPFVVGELALGSLKDRSTFLGMLDELPEAVAASDVEVRALIEREKLHGRGVGYVDAHLLAAALLTPDCRLWTRDSRLRSVAESLSRAALLYH